MTINVCFIITLYVSTYSLIELHKNSFNKYNLSYDVIIVCKWLLVILLTALNLIILYYVTYSNNL